MILRARLAPILNLLLIAPAFGQVPAASEAGSEEAPFPVKFAIYSNAWNARSDAGLRIVAQNQEDQPIRLMQIVFETEESTTPQARLTLELNIPPTGWAELEMPYVDLLTGSECIRNTVNDDWKLAEISNYPLNPSVRGLIIEDTQSFRIFQCVLRAQVHWLAPVTGEQGMSAQWLMYHFERRPRL